MWEKNKWIHRKKTIKTKTNKQLPNETNESQQIKKWAARRNEEIIKQNEIQKKANPLVFKCLTPLYCISFLTEKKYFKLSFYA